MKGEVGAVNVQTERWEEADRVEHAAAKTALTEGLRKLKDGLRSELHQMIDQSEAAFAQSEEAAAKAKAEAHADVEKARRELAVAVQTVADAVEAECASRRTELTAAMNSEAEARKVRAGDGVWDGSRPKAAARLVLKASAGWESPSLRGLRGGDALLLSTGAARTETPDPGASADMGV